MSLFPRTFAAPAFNEMPPIFRLMDDYANLARTLPADEPAIGLTRSGNGRSASGTGRYSNQHHHHANKQQAVARSFAPKFDVSETADAYILHGDLPGISSDNVHVDWEDANTITISGSSTSTHVETDGQQQQQQAEAVEDAAAQSPQSAKLAGKQATVEDEAAADEQTSSADKDKSDAVVKAAAATTPAEAKSASPRFWLMERSYGHFHRTFTLPGRVDNDKVKASLKNGVLEVVVPKAGKPVTKRISITVE